MEARLVALTLVALGIVLAGCIHPSGGPAVKPAANSTSENASCFGSCDKLVAFEETNATDMTGEGSMSHTHDYWMGRERVNVFTSQVVMDPVQPGASYVAKVDFHPPEGHWVFEGTQSVEVTISDPQRHACPGGQSRLNGYYICTDTLGNLTPAPSLPPVADPTGGSTGLTLRFKHASATDWIDAGPITWGKPTTIKITNPTQTDMPHVTSSAWAFEIASPNQYDGTLEFTAKVDIVRGSGPIPLWPPHPNFYPDSHYRKVLDVDAAACDTQGCSLPGYEKAGPVKPARLISYGTRTLFVWANVTDFQAPVPPLAPNNWFLFHDNTTGDENITNPNDAKHPIAQKSNEWILPVDENGMDSPYADGSKWTLQLGAALQGGLSCYAGCAAWAAKYHLTVVASDLALPQDQYDWQCLAGNYCPPSNGTSGAPQQPSTTMVGPDLQLLPGASYLVARAE